MKIKVRTLKLFLVWAFAFAFGMFAGWYSGVDIFERGIDQFFIMFFSLMFSLIAAYITAFLLLLSKKVDRSEP